MTDKDRPCPRCGEAMDSKGEWCPHCGYQTASGVEVAYLLGSPIADMAAGVFAVVLPMLLYFVAALVGYFGAFSIVYLLALGWLLVLAVGFFTFLRPFGTLRRAVARTCQSANSVFA